jgi:hypothetical protein
MRRCRNLLTMVSASTYSALRDAMIYLRGDYSFPSAEDRGESVVQRNKCKTDSPNLLNQQNVTYGHVLFAGSRSKRANPSRAPMSDGRFSPHEARSRKGQYLI